MIRSLSLATLCLVLIAQFFFDTGVQRVLFANSASASGFDCTIVKIVSDSSPHVPEGATASNNNHEEHFACVEEPGNVFRIITGPGLGHFLGNRNETLQRGVQVRFTNALVTGSKIVVSEESKVEVVKSASLSSTRGRNRRLQTLDIETTGTRYLLVVRVTTTNGTVSYDSGEISDRIFGSFGGANTTTQLFNNCSFGQLDFQPSTADGAELGVIDVTVNLPTAETTSDISNFDIMNEAWLQLPGTVSYPDHHLLFVVPKSSVNFKYFSFYSALRSIFNDEYIMSPIAVTQALAINFGVHRSLSSSYDPFGDLSDYMSLDDYETNLDAHYDMCFNAVKNYQFGWYSARSIDISTSTSSWTGTLVATADYDRAVDGEYVLIRLGYFYLQYNKQKGIVAEMQEHGDTVAAYVYSDPVSIDAFQLDGAGANAIASGDTIEICSMSTTEAGVDYAVISIHNAAKGQVSLC